MTIRRDHGSPNNDVRRGARRWRLLAAGAAALTLGGSAGCGAGEVGDESLGVTSDAVVYGPMCVDANSRQCWEGTGGNQGFVFSYFEPAAKSTRVYAKALQEKLVLDPGGSLYGRVSHGQGLPSPVISLTAASPEGKSGTVLALSANSVTYKVSGDLSLGFGGVNFGTWTVGVEALTTAGVAICMKEVEMVRIPAPNVAAFNTIGLGCDGKLYYALNSRWAPASGHEGLKLLPAQTWKHISRTGGSVGATFQTTGNQIWLGMQGSFDVVHSKTNWTAPVQLPAVKDPTGTTLGIKAVGGRRVITTAGDGTCAMNCANGSCNPTGCSGDADRVYTYNAASGAWERFVGGIHWYPRSLGEYAYCTNATSTTCLTNANCPAGGTCTHYSATSYFQTILENGSGVATGHRFGWMTRWRP